MHRQGRAQKARLIQACFKRRSWFFDILWNSFAVSRINIMKITELSNSWTPFWVLLSGRFSLCLRLYVFKEKRIDGQWIQHIFECWAPVWLALDNVARGWVFAHCPVSFQGTTQAEDVVESHTGPDLPKNKKSSGGKRPLIACRDYKGTEESLAWTKTTIIPCSCWDIPYDMTVRSAEKWCEVKHTRI